MAPMTYQGDQQVYSIYYWVGTIASGFAKPNYLTNSGVLGDLPREVVHKLGILQITGESNPHHVEGETQLRFLQPADQPMLTLNLTSIAYFN